MKRNDFLMYILAAIIILLLVRSLVLREREIERENPNCSVWKLKNGWMLNCPDGPKFYPW